MTQIPDSLSSDFLALTFKSFRKEYVELVKDLRKQGCGISEATHIALSLATNLMMYRNNTNFADQNIPVQFIPEEEE